MATQAPVIANEIESAIWKTSVLLGMLQDDSDAPGGFAKKDPDNPVDPTLGRKQAADARLSLAREIESHIDIATSLLQVAGRDGEVSADRAADEQDRLARAKYFAHEIGTASVDCVGGLAVWPQQWDVLKGELAACMRKLRMGNLPASDRPSADNDSAFARMIHVLGGDQVAIIRIMDSDLSADERARQISNLDSRYYAKDSVEWGEMLAVTDAAVRDTAYWRIDRKRFLAESEELRKELAVTEPPAGKAKGRR